VTVLGSFGFPTLNWQIDRIDPRLSANGRPRGTQAEVESNQFAQVVEHPLHYALLLMGRTMACVEHFIDPSIVSRGRHLVQDQVDASHVLQGRTPQTIEVLVLDGRGDEMVSQEYCDLPELYKAPASPRLSRT
jgi:hypothetical protein